MNPRYHNRAILVLLAPWIGMFLVACGVEASGSGSASYAQSEVAALCLSDEDCGAERSCNADGVCASSRAPDVLHDIDSSWARWGVGETPSQIAAERAEHSLCALDNVRTDDLGDRYATDFPSGYWGDEPVPDSTSYCGDAAETLAWRLANCERMMRGLEPLQCDLRLVWLGRQHATDMRERAFFDHVNPDHRDPFERMESRGVTYSLAGENLARFPSVEEAHRAWMESGVHRSTMLTVEYQLGGVGTVRDTDTLLLAQEMMRPLDVARP